MRSDSQLVFEMVEGTGGPHAVLIIDCGGQDSTHTPSATVRYAAPTLAAFSGEGVRDASAAGGSSVTISGSNFGSTAATLRSVTVRDESRGRDFEARDRCSLAAPHRELVCTVPPGPTGSRLVWTLTVDGLRSTFVTKSTHAPAIASVTAHAALGTAGGDTITVTGSNFGVEATGIRALTYGPTGAEYSTSDCAITRPNTEVKCASAAGVGRDLLVRVEIGDQQALGRTSATLSCVRATRRDAATRRLPPPRGLLSTPGPGPPTSHSSPRAVRRPRCARSPPRGDGGDL